MLTQDQAGEMFGRVKKFASADEVEVLFYATANALTRFANNVIHQNMAEENVVVSVRTAFGQRTARATTNKLDDESLRRVVLASEKLARVQHPDGDLSPMFAGEGKSKAADKSVRPTRYFVETAAITPQDRAATVEKIVGVAKRNSLTTAGVVASSEAVEGVFNSRGLAEWYAQTSSEISITMLAGDSS